jgi:predicted DNA-binding transcriptional regulator YafY
MSQMERVFSIDRLLRRRSPPTRAELLRQLATSPATLKRDLDFMRNRLQAPIIWDRVRGGYRYEDPAEGRQAFQIPGLWFSPQEILALLHVRDLLNQLQPGFLAEQLEPLGRRLHELVEASRLTTKRVVVHPTPLRPVDSECFNLVATATLDRKCLAISYFGRHRNAESDRIIEPERLIYYRGTWYVDAWCQTKNDWRRFSLDSIRSIRATATAVVEREFQPGFDTYGIYDGQGRRTATLHFDAEASRWLADEQWHPRQKRTLLNDGSLILQVPFDHPQELLMDVLRYGKHVEVTGPEDLRNAVISSLDSARAVYRHRAGHR